LRYVHTDLNDRDLETAIDGGRDAPIRHELGLHGDGLLGFGQVLGLKTAGKIVPVRAIFLTVAVVHVEDLVLERIEVGGRRVEDDEWAYDFGLGMPFWAPNPGCRCHQYRGRQSPPAARRLGRYGYR